MEHTHVSNIPNLERAILIAAFGGWNDAASASTWAIKYLLNQWDAQQFAEIDPDPFFDFTESRPQVRITQGTVRQLTWPSNRFYMLPPSSSSDPERRRDVVLLLGEEPQLHWKTFTQEILDLCRQCQIEDIALLGSLVAEVPHTVPVQVSGTASRSPMLKRMSACGVERATYTGTTGMQTVLQDAAHKAGFVASSLWGVAPHYISATPNLAVSEALLRKLDMLYGFELQLKDLSRAAQRFTARVSSLVAEDPDISAYVRELEQRRGGVVAPFADFSSVADASSTRHISFAGELPSPEQAIASVEEFLRQFREGSGAD
ncbi:MAG: PAC2 family protein [Ktedonobacterales bacterium]|nr:PAC2 family protein [Ktedonobacterales bacterium]